jgi:hypothetical protein
MFWRNRINRYLATAPDLSPAQVTYLKSVVISQEMLDRDRGSAQIAQFEKEGRAVLGDARFKYLFVTFGPEDSNAAASEPLGLQARVGRWIASRFSVVADAGGCACSRESDWCGYYTDCEESTCTFSTWVEPELVWNAQTETWVLQPGHWWPGCGTLLDYQCNGTCQYLELNQ